MKTEILSPTPEALAYARSLIADGEVVAFHTETVYGLGANACSDEAVAKIFELKGRPSDNPLIVHLPPETPLAPFVDEDPPYCADLRRAFLPGPLTMVYPSDGKVSPLVSCGLRTLAIRIPASPVAQAFLREAGVPIAAPSANLSKHVSPVTAQHVYHDFAGKIPLILDGGACSGGIESTVLDCTGDFPVILRQGLVTQEMIEEVAGRCEIYHMQAGEKPKSPGMAYKHYSPRCKTYFFETVEDALHCYQAQTQKGERVAVLCESEQAKRLKDCAVLDLGETPTQMANRLYALLRKAEQIATVLIGIEPKEKEGVMAGVRNRLHRAFGIEI